MCKFLHFYYYYVIRSGLSNNLSSNLNLFSKLSKYSERLIFKNIKEDLSAIVFHKRFSTS